MKTKSSINRILSTMQETDTKFGLIKRIAYVQGSHKNEAHYVHTSKGAVVSIKRVPRWQRASIYN